MDQDRMKRYNSQLKSREDSKFVVRSFSHWSVENPLIKLPQIINL